MFNRDDLEQMSGWELYQWGQQYFKGGYYDRPISANFEQSRKYFLNAILKGHVEAYTQLGFLYQNPPDRYHVRQDRDTIFFGKYSIQRKDSDHIPTQEDLNTVIRISSQLDKPIALNCFIKAIQLGDTKAYDGLGAIFYYGLGVPKDKIQAYTYYRWAAQDGNTPCTLLELEYEYGDFESRSAFQQSYSQQLMKKWDDHKPAPRHPVLTYHVAVLQPPKILRSKLVKAMTHLIDGDLTQVMPLLEEHPEDLEKISELVSQKSYRKFHRLYENYVVNKLVLVLQLAPLHVEDIVNIIFQYVFNEDIYSKEHLTKAKAALLDKKHNRASLFNFSFLNLLPTLDSKVASTVPPSVQATETDTVHPQLFNILEDLKVQPEEIHTLSDPAFNDFRLIDDIESEFENVLVQKMLLILAKLPKDLSNIVFNYLYDLIPNSSISSKAQLVLTSPSGMMLFCRNRNISKEEARDYSSVSLKY